MAITSNSYTGNGSTTLYSFTFPYLDESHVKITLNGTLTTAYTFANATTIQFNTAPGAGVAIRIYRETNNDQTEATFFAGSSIKAQDLNNNFTQTLYTVQEVVDRYLSKVGDTMQGILNMGGFKITNLGVPTSGTDATTKTYVDTHDALKVNKAGDTMSGNLAMGGNKVTGLGSPSGSADAATKSYVDGYINTTYLGPSATDPTTRPGGSPLQVGDQYFNTNQNILKAWTGTVWVISAAAGSIVRWRKTASAGNTTLSGVDDLGITLSYVVGNEQVYLNGALQTRGVDYTAGTGNSITFTPALLAGDVVELHAVQGYVSATITPGSINDALVAPAAGIQYSKLALSNSIVNADVNASAGIVASKLAFTQSGAGAVGRTVDSKLKDAVSVWDFGVVGDGVVDDTVALQAFFTHIASNDVGTAYCSGNFLISSGLTLGSGTVATKHIVGDLNLTATTAIDTMLSINGFTLGTWNGDVTVTGTGSVSYSSRTCRAGVLVTNSGRAKFDKIVARRFYQFGVHVSSSAVGGGNTTLVNLGDVDVSDCGSGYPGGSNLTSTWSNPVNSGSSGSTGQRTVIDVTTLPPNQPEPIVVFINGASYYVYSVDYVNSKLTVFPWVDNTLTTGTLEYVTGAGVYIVGVDAGIVNLDMVDATRCSVGLWSDALYGCIAKRVVTQFCLSAVAVGGDPGDAAVTFSINGLYCENNTADFLRITRASIGGFIAAEYAFNWSKVFYTTDARLTGNTFNDSFNNLQTVIVNTLGVAKQFKRLRNGRREGSSTLALSVAAADSVPDDFMVYYRNSWTVNLQTPSAGLNYAFGDQARSIAFIGTGNNGSPTGTFTFNPPATYTVNGGASATFTGFTGPAVFLIYWLTATSDFQVRCLNQVNQASATFNPPSIAAAGQTTTTVTCTGAALGDYAAASFSLDQQGITLDSYVSAADTVTVVFRNGTAGPIDLGSGTLRVRTFKP